MSGVTAVISAFTQPAAGGGGDYAATAVTFNTTTIANRNTAWTGISNAKTGIISFWLKGDVEGAGNLRRILRDGGTNFYLKKTADNEVTLEVYDAAMTNTLSLRLRSNNSVASNGSWHHYLFVWDVATAGNNWVIVDGVDRTDLNTRVDNSLKYDTSSWEFGYDASGGIVGDMCEFYVAFGQWIDASVASNVQKFRTTGAKPVDLGAAGATPTGTSPTIYSKTLSSAMATNSGSGGNFSSVTSFSSATAP